MALQEGICFSCHKQLTHADRVATSILFVAELRDHITKLEAARVAAGGPPMDVEVLIAQLQEMFMRKPVDSCCPACFKENNERLPVTEFADRAIAPYLETSRKLGERQAARQAAREQQRQGRWW